MPWTRADLGEVSLLKLVRGQIPDYLAVDTGAKIEVPVTVILRVSRDVGVLLSFEETALRDET